MNKILQFSLIIAITSLFGACCNTTPVINVGATTDTFRVGLKTGQVGLDVKHWQSFLLQKGFGPVIATGTFDQATTDATTRFQKSHCYGGSGGIIVTGTVTFATYAKAVRAGMPKYNPITGLHLSKSHKYLSRTTKTSELHPLIGGTSATIYLPMKQRCQDTPTVHGVALWQQILGCLGYSITDTPGDFFVSTTAMTKKFQLDAQLTKITSGVVDAGITYPAALMYCQCPVTIPNFGPACP